MEPVKKKNWSKAGASEAPTWFFDRVCLPTIAWIGPLAGPRSLDYSTST